jgi:hypothetical protein
MTHGNTGSKNFRAPVVLLTRDVCCLIVTTVKGYDPNRQA